MLGRGTSARIESLVPDLESHLAFKKKINIQSFDEGYFPPLGKVIGGQVVMELARIFLGYSPPKTFGRFYEFDMEEVDPIGHDVLRFPRCPACYFKKSPMDLWDSSPIPNGE
ncbi:MAG: hypothetical protein H8E32_00815 [Nitrospinae bacterium]|nr:hypothetical protein [Nitrospinota bacterium]